jgi:hypothetical protein
MPEFAEMFDEFKIKYDFLATKYNGVKKCNSVVVSDLA